jgi:hypothetical protein
VPEGIRRRVINDSSDRIAAYQVEEGSSSGTKAMRIELPMRCYTKRIEPVT